MKQYNKLAILLLAATITGCGGTPQTAKVDTAAAATAPPEHEKASVPQPIAEPVSKVTVDDRVINHVPLDARKQIALTFDDGPDNKYTPKILDILKKNQIKATFFLVGEHAERYPDTVKRIAEEGHIIGNHTWDHQDLAKLPPESIHNEIAKTDEMIKKITGQSPSLFRAPYGAVNEQVKSDAASSGHMLIGWSVDTMDWDGKTVQQIMAAVKKEAAPGAIILQHSSGGKKGNLNNTVEALPQIIAYLKNNGYSFVTVPELLTSLKSN